MLFAIISVAILAAFYGCYFAKMIAQKRQGITTDQMGKGKTGLVKGIEITMKVASYAVPVAEIVSIALGTTAFPAAVRALGALMGTVGVGFFVASVLTMRDNWRAGVSETDRTELVTEGVYQLSRNPAFLGFDLVYLGILLMFFNPALMVISLFAMLMFHLQIVNVEEDFLLVTFGEDYLAYRKRVRRYLGRK